MNYLHPLASPGMLPLTDAYLSYVRNERGAPHVRRPRRSQRHRSRALDHVLPARGRAGPATGTGSCGPAPLCAADQRRRTRAHAVAAERGLVPLRHPWTAPSRVPGRGVDGGRAGSRRTRGARGALRLSTASCRTGMVPSPAACSSSTRTAHTLRFPRSTRRRRHLPPRGYGSHLRLLLDPSDVGARFRTGGIAMEVEHPGEVSVRRKAGSKRHSIGSGYVGDSIPGRRTRFRGRGTARGARGCQQAR